MPFTSILTQSRTQFCLLCTWQLSPSAIPYLHKYIHICVYIYIILCGTFILLSDILSGESRILKRGFQCAHDWSHKAREARVLGGCGLVWPFMYSIPKHRGLFTWTFKPLNLCSTWGTCPPRKFLLSDLLRSLLVPFWGETARVGRPTANLVIVFEIFKHSHNLKAWLRFAREARENFFS